MRPGVMRHAKFTGEGRIEQIGTPLELYHQPRTRFVAGFLGAPAMNFIPAEVAGDLLRLPGGGLLVCPGMRLGKAELGVRPERIRVVEQPAQAHLQGTVTPGRAPRCRGDAGPDAVPGRALPCSAQRLGGAGRRPNNFSRASPIAISLRSLPAGPSSSRPIGSLLVAPSASGICKPGTPALLPGSVFWM